MSVNRHLTNHLNDLIEKEKKITKPQVIFAWNYLTWGGAQIYFLALIKEVAKEFEVKMLLPENSDSQLIKFIEEAAVDYELFSPPFIPDNSKGIHSKLKNHLAKIKSEYSMLRHLDKFDLENSIVHIELGPWQSLLATVWLCLRTQVFITQHNSLPDVSGLRYLIWKLKLKAISRFKSFHPFSSNQDSKNYFRGLYTDKKFDEIVVTYTSVDSNEIEEALKITVNRDKLLNKYKIPKEKFLIFCVGQFIDRKGRWTFLEAAKNLAKNNKDVAFVWISNSEPTPQDILKVKEYGLKENFIIITSDQVGERHIDLFELLRLADVFALVSFQEGLPISLLEAMALGIPSISTNVNAIPEAVKHLETGWLIEAGDSVALEKAFRKLKKDKKLRMKLSSNGKKYVLENFNDEVVGKIALKNYKKALE